MSIYYCDECKDEAWRRLKHEVDTLRSNELGNLRSAYGALKKLVAAEDRFVKESGVPLDDPVADAVKYAKEIIRVIG